MRFPPALFAVLTAVAIACWFGLSAQQQTPVAVPADTTPVAPVPMDPGDVSAAAKSIAERSAHLKPMLDEVHPPEWVAKGAPETYVSQWNSLKEQNQAIASDMAVIARNAEAKQNDAVQAATLGPLLQALFRVHRFDGDLEGLRGAIRRYQNPALADLIESVAEGGERGVETLQRYAVQLAADKDRQLDVVDKEAQRCRALLAAQPVSRPSAQRKTTAPQNPAANGTPK
jgi:hypothetical protein